MTSLRTSALPRREEVLLDLIDDAVDVGHGDRALGAGDAEALQQLVAVERLAPAVALDDQQRLRDLLVGREALTALLAFPAPPDAVAGGAGVHDPRVWLYRSKDTALLAPVSGERKRHGPLRPAARRHAREQWGMAQDDVGAMCAWVALASVCGSVRTTPSI